MRANRLCGQPGSLMERSVVAARYGVELEPCPFCRGVPAMHITGRSPHVTCTSCAANGPSTEISGRVDRDEATARAAQAWNGHTPRQVQPNFRAI